MANCGKHFPGHGFVKADSHTDIPVDKRSLKAILADAAAPYGWLNTALNAGCDLGMLCNQAVDGGQPVDELLAGPTEAQLKGRWQFDEFSETRRLAMLSTTPAPIGAV